MAQRASVAGLPASAPPVAAFVVVLDVVVLDVVVLDVVVLDVAVPDDWRAGADPATVGADVPAAPAGLELVSLEPAQATLAVAHATTATTFIDNRLPANLTAPRMARRWR